MFGKALASVKILSIICLLGLSSCLKDNNKATYTIEGRLIDGTNPSNKFANRKLKFQNTIDYRDIDLLGEATTDTNGYFKMSYEFSKDYRLNHMQILVDSSFIAAKKLVSLEIASNWNKMFYLGDSASFNLYINMPLGINDTLFLSDWDSLFSVLGPCSTGFVKKIKCLNYNKYKLIGYGIGMNNYMRSQKLTSFAPTGEPIVDELHLDLIN